MDKREILALVRPEWRDDFVLFTETGQASDEFHVYLKEDEKCQKALEQVVQIQARQFDKFVDHLWHEETLKALPLLLFYQSILLSRVEKAETIKEVLVAHKEYSQGNKVLNEVMKSLEKPRSSIVVRAGDRIAIFFRRQWRKCFQ